MTRIKGIYGKQLLEQQYITFDFQGIWKDTMGTPARSGFWIIYGAEKNGKTWFALKLAEYLSGFGNTLFISGEQGTGYAFQDGYKRAGLNPQNRHLKFTGYKPLDEIELHLDKRKSPEIVIWDNITVYADELKNGNLRRLQLKYKHKLFVFVAHQEQNEPYTATAKLCKKLSDIIVRVNGLVCEISGRCPGGRMIIDEQKATLFHGTQILENDQ